MRFFAFLVIAGGVVTLPFLFLRAPWAVRLWDKVRLIAVVYAVAILVAAIVALIFRWDQIYG
jgi:glutamine amidotransferase PdxT